MHLMQVYKIGCILVFVFLYLFTNKAILNKLYGIMKLLETK